MTVRFAIVAARLVLEFFAWETIWGASSLLRVIYWSRMLLLCVPIVAALTVIDVAVSWPRETDGEEHLVLQREFQMEQQRNREVQQDLRLVIDLTRSEVRELQRGQNKLENFQQRIEEKFDLGAKILGAICSVLIGQLISYLLNIRLKRELLRMKTRGLEP